jgi:hypothetical protein
MGFILEIIIFSSTPLVFWLILVPIPLCKLTFNSRYVHTVKSFAYQFLPLGSHICSPHTLVWYFGIPLHCPFDIIIICRDVDVFGAGNVHLNHFLKFIWYYYYYYYYYYHHHHHHHRHNSFVRLFVCFCFIACLSAKISVLICMYVFSSACL